MSSDFRSSRAGVSVRFLGLFALAALLFVAGCTTGGGAAFGVSTTSSQLASVVINTVYPNATLTAANGTAPYTWSITSGALPTGMSLSNAGVLSGTPTAAGTFNFTVSVTDSATPTAHTATANLTVMINPALSSVSVSPNSVTGGTGTSGTVTLTAAAATPASVTLSSNNGAATVAGTVTVAAGSTSANFQITTSGVTTSTPVTITGTYGVSKTASLTVNPPTVQSVALSASTVTGGTGVTGTVTLSGPAATGGDTVTLSSGNTAAATVPASVAVAAGATTATFNITTLAVASSKTSSIQASFNSSSQASTLTVLPALAIIAPALPTGVVGVNYSALAFTASGGSGAGYTFTVASGALPAPLTLGASTGLVSAGPPTTAGTYTFTVKVTDSLGFTATTGSLSITINAAISVTLSPTGPVTLDQGKTQLVTATVNNDPSNAGVTWSAVTGLGSLTGSTGTSTTYNTPGSVSTASTATFKATSVTDPTKSATFTVNLVPPPQITTASMAAGNVNGAYSSPVSMSDGVAPYTWAIVAAPAGLSLSNSTTSTVTVQGTPTVSGNNQTFTIKVTDAQGLSTTSSGLTITIYPTLTITPPSFPVGVVNVSYSSPAFSAAGGSSSGYTFAVASGSISPLTIAPATGAISGTPTTSGTLHFTVKVTDSVGNVATSGALSITINPAITVGFSPAGPVTMDQAKTQLVTATVTNDPNNAGVNWSAVTGLGTLTGQTTTSVTYNAPVSVATASTATFTATSVTDPTKSATFTVNLVPPPQITTSSMAAGNVNGAYSSPVSLTGGVAPFTWAIVAAPAGLTLSGSTTSTVTVQGTPTASGNNQTFTIKATDAQGLSTTSSGLTISIYSQLVLTPPSTPLPTGVVGVNYPTTETFTASGGSGTGYTWSIVAGGSLPAGLSLSAASGATTSITAGPPTTAGSYPFTVKLSDSVGNTATTSGLSITINPPINITFTPSQPFAMDQNTSQLVTATVNNDPNNAGVNWSSLTGLGSLSGATSTTITYNAPATIASTSIATFTATSVTDPTKSASFSISLEPPPVIANPSFPTGTLNVAYGPAAVTVNGGVGPYTWAGTALPPGLSLSSSTTSTVNVQGTPTSAGANQTVTIKVTDAKGLTNTLNSTITVNAPSCASNCTISGTVSGPQASGVAVALTGPASANTTTDGGGNYSFTGLTGGTYTVTPTLAGYTFTPSAPSVTTATSTTVQNFTETSALGSFSISGTVTYGGAQPGRAFVLVYNNNCVGCGNAMAGTSIALTSGSGAYTVRGLQGNNSYVVSVFIDAQGTGLLNDSNPTGSSSTVTITNANVTGANVTVTDPTPPTPVTPNSSKMSVNPSNGVAVIQYKAPTDNNGGEIATSYKVYYGTDVNATNGSGSPKTFKAQGNNTDVLFLSGLANGATNFKMTALVGTTESAPSGIVSATIGATTGNFTISGTVTVPSGMGNGPLYVGVYGGASGNSIYVERFAQGSYGTSVAYSISGVPNGTYQNFAIVDENSDGEIGVPDLANVGSGNGSAPTVVVNGANLTGQNLDLTPDNFTTQELVRTSYQQSNSNPYQIGFQANWGTKRPVSIALISGPNVPAPWDLIVDQNNGEYSPSLLNGAVPQVGDTYQFQVLFSDGTSQTLSSSVTAVLNANSVARNISETTTSPYSTTVPLFTWASPVTPPSVYYYAICVNNQNGVSLNWCDYGNNNGLPSTQTSIVYNADGSASSSSLSSGTTYNINLQVNDANGNSAQSQSTYTVP